MRRAILFLASWVLAVPALAWGPIYYKGTGCDYLASTTPDPCTPGTPVSLWISPYWNPTGTAVWDFGDGSPTVTANATATVQHTYSSLGAYTPKATMNGMLLTGEGPVKVGYSLVKITGGTTTESSGSATLTVSRNSAPTAVTVGYKTVDDTAKAGVRYVATTSSVTLAAGELSKTISIPLIDDSKFETLQGFWVYITSVSSGYFEGDYGFMNIKDDDPPPTFALASTTLHGNETDGSFTMTVKRTGDLLMPMTIGYNTWGTNSGAIVAKQSGSIDFAPGETSKSVAFAIHDDSIYEGAQDVQVLLTSYDPALFLGSKTFDVTLDDNEPPPSISVSDATVVEGNGEPRELTFNVSLSGRVDRESVNVTWGNTGTSLLFTSDSTSKTITIPITGDTKIGRNQTISVHASSTRLQTARNGTGTVIDDDAEMTPLVMTRADKSASTTFRWGEPLAADTPVAITTLGEIIAASTITAAAGSTSLSIPFTATKKSQITATMNRGPVTLKATGQVDIVSANNFVAIPTPSPLTMHLGNTANLSIAIDPPQSAATNVTLVAADTTVIDVPTLIAVPPGTSATAPVAAKKLGTTTITLSTASGVSYVLPVTVSMPAAPMLTSIEPAAGPTAGGTHVTLHGDGFDATCTVAISFYAATEVVVSDSQTITAVTPPNFAGRGPVSVTCGTFSTTLNDAFTYIVPRRRPAR